MNNLSGGAVGQQLSDAKISETTMKRYRILKYPWHTGHDYELVKLPHDFFFLTETHRNWARSQRPIPSQVTWVPTSDSVETDCMILHLDQWSFDEPAKRFLFLRYRDSYSGPKIVINHGSNAVDGMPSDVLATLVEGCYMVCNSATALRYWGMEQSRHIMHGMSPEEWAPTNYGRPEVLVIQPYSSAHGIVRNIAGIEKAEQFVPITWIGRDVRFDSFAKFRHFLQSSSIYFNPSYASANPRSRTEAMLTGLAIVTTASNGEEEYIENGRNGFCSNDFDELIEYLIYLHKRPDEVRRLGIAGRETAQRVFNIDRFISQWNDLLSDILDQ